VSKTDLNVERILRPIVPAEGRGAAASEYSEDGSGRYYGYDYGPIEEARRIVEPTVLHGDEGDKLRALYAQKPQPADWNKVLKLGTDVLATESKDLQVCAWVVEALGKLRGFDGLREGFDLIRQLQEAFWPSAYPRIEDGDTYDRRYPYESLSADESLPLLIRSIPLTDDGSGGNYSYLKRTEAVESEQTYQGRFESEGDREAWLSARVNKYKKILLKNWEDAVQFTEPAFFEETAASLRACFYAFKRWERSTDDLFGRASPDLSPIERAIDDVGNLLIAILEKNENPAAETLSNALERARAGHFEDPEPEPDETEDAVEDGPPDDDLLDDDRPGDVDDEERQEEAGVRWPSSPPVARARPVGRREPSGPAVEPQGDEAAGSARDLTPEDAEGAYRQILAAVAFLRERDADDPVPYLVARALRAGEVFRGEELIGPSRETRTTLARLASAGEWGDLIEPAERAIGGPEGRGWLDGHRLAIQALESEGRTAAAAACRGSLIMLLDSSPGLADRTLDDGTPAANPETLAWLEENLGTRDARPDPPRESTTAGPTGGPTEGPSVEAEALELVDAGDLAGAIRLLNAAATAAPTDRERFSTRLRLAEICVEGWLNSLALPILDDLTAAIDGRRLESWEGVEYCARVARSRFLCLQQSGGGRTDELLIAAYERLVRLDPAAALTYKWDKDA